MIPTQKGVISEKNKLKQQIYFTFQLLTDIFIYNFLNETSSDFETANQL